jgi:hypothetical protein
VVPTWASTAPRAFSLAGTRVSAKAVRKDSVTASRMKLTTRGNMPSRMTFLMRASRGLPRATTTCTPGVGGEGAEGVG